MCILFAPMYRIFKTCIFIALLFCFGQSQGQARFKLGLSAGGTISKNLPSDTLPKNFTSRNKVGLGVGIVAQYDLRKMMSITFGILYVGKGYKVNNDTLPAFPSVSKQVNTINIPVGISFRQNFNSSNFIQEKFGFSANISLDKDSTSARNNGQYSAFRINEKRLNPIYPMFYLGVGMGGTSENGDRYEFGVTYYQSFSKDAQLTVQHSKNFSKSFPLNYRGGFIMISFSYYFNLANFKRSSDYFE